MKVTLFDYTGRPDPWEAANILIFTKMTRMTMSPGLLDSIRGWKEWDKLKELEYMANTVPSSWEFAHYSFIIEGVTRAFTHQLVRTRTASYAQQAMRVLNVSEGPGWTYGTGPTIEDDPSLLSLYRNGMEGINRVYRSLIEKGATVQDARGILPTNIHTNICVSINLRALADLLRKRSSERVQDEYREVVRLLRTAVLEVHPWAALFLDKEFDQVAIELGREISSLPISGEHQIRLHKLVDQMRRLFS